MSKKAKLGAALTPQAIKEAQSAWEEPTPLLRSVPTPTPQGENPAESTNTPEAPIEPPRPAQRPTAPTKPAATNPPKIGNDPHTWDNLTHGRATRGSSQATHQIHIPVPTEVYELLQRRDHEIITGGGEHPISRHLLLTHAIDMVTQDPQSFEPLDAPGERKNISGRVDTDHKRALALLRHGPHGKQATAPLIAAAIERILR
jgi:hypothetical protein